MSKFLIIFVVFLFPFFASGQEEPELPEDAEKKEEPAENFRTCKVICLQTPSSKTNFVYLVVGNTSHKIFVSRVRFSEKIQIPRNLTELSLTMEEPEEGKNLPENTQKLELPAEIDDFFIILQSNPENKEHPWEMILVDSSKYNTQVGQTLWMNFTEHTIIAKLGDTDVAILPMAHAISAAPQKESGYYRAEFSYKVKGEGATIRMMEKSWFHQAQQKNVGFIVDSKQRFPRIFSLWDK